MPKSWLRWVPPAACQARADQVNPGAEEPGGTDGGGLKRLRRHETHTHEHAGKQLQDDGDGDGQVDDLLEHGGIVLKGSGFVIEKLQGGTSGFAG
jgi:hypothetical protein